MWWKRKAAATVVRVWSVLFLSIVPNVAAFGASLADFNPFPELPYEATTLAQDELIPAAKRTLGNGVEA
ncbi:MAG TPA: hypothetical protein PKL84_02885, partial [Candidatus Hydrogenedentes bacterium]|nr:hypothetical protein [Candidatus Hydrogenedentota bacterium]